MMFTTGVFTMLVGAGGTVIVMSWFIRSFAWLKQTSIPATAGSRFKQHADIVQAGTPRAKSGILDF